MRNEFTVLLLNDIHLSCPKNVKTLQLKLAFHCILNSIAFRTAKTLWSFGRSECNRVRWLVSFELLSDELLGDAILLSFKSTFCI